MSQDEEHLGLLAIFHYIVGGLAGIFSFFPLIYAFAGVLILKAPVPKRGEAPPELFGWIFIGFGCFLFLLGVAIAICVALSGRFIKRHEHYKYSFVLACIECLFIPFGTVLGVFTILVLSRQSVRQLYGIRNASDSTSANG